MKGKEGLLSGRIVWGAMLGGGAVLAGLLVDWLLFSPDFANDQRAIGARRFFYEQIIERYLPPSHWLYGAYAREAVEEEGKRVYEYALTGRVEGLEKGGCMLRVRGAANARWRFFCESQTYPAREGEEYRKLMVAVTRAAGGEQSHRIAYHLFDSQGAGAGEALLRAGDLVKIRWREERKLSEIEEAVKAGGVIPLYVIPKGQGIIPIQKIVGEGE